MKTQRKNASGGPHFGPFGGVRFEYQDKARYQQIAAATGHFSGRCVRKVLETQKTSGRKSEKKYRIPTEYGTFMVAGEGFEPSTSGL